VERLVIIYRNKCVFLTDKIVNEVIILPKVRRQDDPCCLECEIKPKAKDAASNNLMKTKLRTRSDDNQKSHIFTLVRASSWCDLTR
jgi:hypothetical protein